MQQCCCEAIDCSCIHTGGGSIEGESDLMLGLAASALSGLSSAYAGKALHPAIIMKRLMVRCLMQHSKLG